MKKILSIVVVVLLLSAIFVSCTERTTQETDTSPSQSESPAPPTPKPETTSEPTPEPPPAQADMWRLSSEWLFDHNSGDSHSGVLLRFYELDREYFYRVTRDGLDLGYTNSLWLDGDSETTGIYRLVPSVPLNNFRWLSTMWWDRAYDGPPNDDYTEEFSADSISWENPFVFRHGQAGSFAFRGISFTDNAGTTRYFRAGSCMLFGGFRIVNEHFMSDTE